MSLRQRLHDRGRQHVLQETNESSSLISLPAIPRGGSISDWTRYDDAVLSINKINHETISKTYVEEITKLKRTKSALSTSVTVSSSLQLYRLVRAWVTAILRDTTLRGVLNASKVKRTALKESSGIQVLIRYANQHPQTKQVVLRDIPYIFIHAYNTEILNAAIKAAQTNKPKQGLDKVEVRGSVGTLSSLLHPRAYPGPPGVGLAINTPQTATERAGFSISTLGVCLIDPTSNIQNPKDKVITTWHGVSGGHVGADVFFPIPRSGGGGDDFAFVGTIESSTHRTDLARDYDIVKLRPRYSCDCEGIHDITQTFRDVEALQEYMISVLEDKKTNFNAYARTFVSGLVYPELSEWGATLHIKDDDDNLDYAIILTKDGTRKGDSGSALVVNNQIVGIHHGGFRDPEDKSGHIHGAWYPIWYVNIPQPYRFCL